MYRNQRLKMMRPNMPLVANGSALVAIAMMITLPVMSKKWYVALRHMSKYHYRNVTKSRQLVAVKVAKAFEASLKRSAITGCLYLTFLALPP